MDAQWRSYHESQWYETKRSTELFSRFFHDQISHSRNVTDLGCGAGAVTFYLASLHSRVSFLGLDIQKDLIDLAQSKTKQRKQPNLEFKVADWYEMGKMNLATGGGVVSVQALSWLKDMEEPMANIFDFLSPEWIGISSLFYQGDISCKIEVNEHKRDRISYYNTYSLKKLERIANEHGYCLKRYEPFEIDIDLPRKSNLDTMGTYTERVVDSPNSFRRIQFSGPLLMNWYFVLLTKI